MLLIRRQRRRHIRPLHHIHRQEGRQPGHAEELVGLVEREVHRVHALAFEEIAGSSNACCGAFQVSDSMYCLPWISPPLPYFCEASERVRPSLAYRLPWPAVNTSSMYCFTVHGAPIHQPGIW
jgi:hypothetical protein